jgi:hypothetical protein
MTVEIEFDSVSQRKHIHQIIQDTAREIESHTDLLETLLFLENGAERQDGFGYVELNDPTSDTVLFYVGEDQFREHLTVLEGATTDDLDRADDEHEEQIQSLIDQLHEARDTMEDTMLIFD